MKPKAPSKKKVEWVKDTTTHTPAKKDIQKIINTILKDNDDGYFKCKNCNQLINIWKMGYIGNFPMSRGIIEKLWKCPNCEQQPI